MKENEKIAIAPNFGQTSITFSTTKRHLITRMIVASQIKDGTSKFRGIFVQFMAMQEKQILAKAKKKKKTEKKGVATHFSEIMKQDKFLKAIKYIATMKYKVMYGFFFFFQN